MSQQSILDDFPKKRIKLPEEFQEIYNHHYLSNREGKYKTTSFSKKLESWMHKKVAEDVTGKNKKYSTLEIGAGTLNQLKYEPAQEAYDIVEPFKELFVGSQLLKSIRNVYDDISDINNIIYDRITSIATFEHIINLPLVVSKAAMLLNKENGNMRVAIPNEGTILWKLGTIITGFEFEKKYHLNYQVLMQYEHVNTAKDIEAVLNYFFESTKCSVFGIRKGLALYRFYDCRKPRLNRVSDYFSKNGLLSQKREPE